MEIYPQEIEDGLSEALSAKASIVYASQLTHCPIQQSRKSKINIKALAGIEDKDLYYTQSILVTSSWNKNDDIFDRAEVWAARNTPEDKPTNLEHDESIIVGHITSNWPIMPNGDIIDQNTSIEDLPEKFHILTGSVIYTGFTDPDLKDRTAQLINEIQSGNKYVSMECFFNSFDYGLMDKITSNYKILPRNSETAFLTKHLRAYGGLGEHQNYKIGRVLRNITFSGKGFVSKPANPDSVIFTKDNMNFDKQIQNIELNKEKNEAFVKVGVFSNQANLKENIMSVETENQEVAAITEKEGMKMLYPGATPPGTQSAEEHEEELKKKEEEMAMKYGMLKKQEEEMAMKHDMLKKQEEEMATKHDGLKKKEEEMAMKYAEMAKMQTELNNVYAALETKKKELAETMKKDKKMKRVATLIQSGVDSEVVNNVIDTLENVDDISFDSIATLVSAVKPVKVVDVKTNTNLETEDSQHPFATISDALETAEVEKDIDLSVGSETENESHSTRAALVDFVYSRLGKKLNKGE
jgi:hypothetical protein